MVLKLDGRHSPSRKASGNICFYTKQTQKRICMDYSHQTLGAHNAAHVHEHLLNGSVYGRPKRKKEKRSDYWNGVRRIIRKGKRDGETVELKTVEPPKPPKVDRKTEERILREADFLRRSKRFKAADSLLERYGL